MLRKGEMPNIQSKTTKMKAEITGSLLGDLTIGSIVKLVLDNSVDGELKFFLIEIEDKK